MIGGVKVGQVKSIELSPKGDFRARVMIDIDKNLKLPDDTAASILTQGVLGSQYIGLEPGGSDTMLAERRRDRLHAERGRDRAADRPRDPEPRQLDRRRDDSKPSAGRRGGGG